MLIKTIIAFCAFAVSAQASTLAFATGGGRGHQFILSDGATRVTAGSLVRLGYLATPGVMDSFVEYGRSTISNPSPAIAIGGFLTTPVNNTTPADNTAAQGKQIYLWVYNAPTAGAATQHGLFTSSTATWVIPSTFTGGATESFNVTLGASTAPAFSAVAASIGTFTTGVVGVGTGVDNTAGSIYRLAPIPEPTTSMFALGIIGMGLIRRRR